MIRNINPLQFSIVATPRFNQIQKQCEVAPEFSALSRNKKQTLTVVGGALGLLTALVSVFSIGYGRHVTSEIIEQIQLEKQFGSRKVPDNYISHLTLKEKEKITNGEYFVAAIFTSPILQLRGTALIDVTGKIPKPVRFVDLSSTP